MAELVWTEQGMGFPDIAFDKDTLRYYYVSYDPDIESWTVEMDPGFPSEEEAKKFAQYMTEYTSQTK